MTNDEFGLLRTGSFSWGIMQIFTAYVALVSITIGDFRQAVEGSASGWNTSPERLELAKKTIVRGALEGIGIFMAIIVASAITIPLITQPIDDRMELIIQGINRFISAAVFALLSFRVGFWIGLYDIPSFWYQRTKTQKLGTTQAELKHRIRWAISKDFLRMLFVLWFLLEGISDWVTIPASIFSGIVLGFAIDFAIYKCRRIEAASRRKLWSIILVTLLAITVVLQVSTGTFFIASVWQTSGDEDVSEETWSGIAFIIAVFVMPIAHVMVWYIGRKQMEIKSRSFMETDGDSKPMDDSRTRKQRMATSMIFSMRNLKKLTSRSAPSSEPTPAEGDKPQSAAGPYEQGIAEEASGEMDDSEVKEEAPDVVQEAPDVGEGDPDLERNVSREEMMENYMEQKPSSDDHNDTAGEGIEAEDKDEEESNPSLRSLMMDWQLCGCARGDEMSSLQKASNVFVWILYLLMCGICIFYVVMNTGATAQQENCRDKLPFVHEAIYKTMNDGPVCAFDNRGADSNITTFADKDAAHAEGFLIVHCGACGACSDWHNLRLEYTTRHCLAKEGKECAVKSLFGGGYDELVSCLESDKIGFQGQCAICWADDILCTKKFCSFIGIQSFFINTLGDFAVENNTITAAACEEANCEAGNPGEFVSCSGATRRRMNITSSIGRPGAQRCEIVDVDWAELFPEDTTC